MAWRVTITEDCGASFNDIVIEARSYTEAYIEASLRYPDAIITNIESV